LSHFARQLASGGGDTDQERIGITGLSERRDDWDVSTQAEQLLAGFAGVSGVEDGDDLVAAVADDLGSGLGRAGGIAGC